MRQERRNNFRVEWKTAARIYSTDGTREWKCVIGNLSNGGARITGIAPDTLPETFVLRISARAVNKQCHVLWRTKDALGVQFVNEPDANPKGQQRSNQMQLA